MNDQCSNILGWLLEQSVSIQSDPVDSIREWKNRYDENAANWQEPVDRAISGGFLANRTAFAFLAGFFSALQRLLPDLPKDKITAFCISEEGGAHPRAIKTRLEKKESGNGGWFLNGRKQFITCATEAESILVAASTGAGADGRNQIRLTLIDRHSEGVKIEPMPDLPFIPEIRHGVVYLENVAVNDDQLLPGDAYDYYIKPFRTIEDIHISAGVLGFLLRCASLYQWPSTVRETLLGAVAGIRPLAVSDPLSPQIHIALAGWQQSTDRIISELDNHWESAPEADKKAWERDRAILGIAKKARTARLETAWKGYSAEIV